MHLRFDRLRLPSLVALLCFAVLINCSDDPGGAAPDTSLDAGSDSSDDARTAGDADSGDDDADVDPDAGDDRDGGDSGLRCPPVMKAIPAGSFVRTGVNVTVGTFCLDQREVSLGSFKACVTAGVCDAIPPTVDDRCNSRNANRDGHPVDCVSAAQAEMFCAWMGKRLPTSDELSWAARGAVPNAKYPWGSVHPAPGDNPSRLCWAPVSPDHTCLPGSFESGASPQEIFDLAGNVWEWTATEAGAGNRRVQGGAYWDEAPLELFQADHWEPMPADTAVPAYGFRCAI